MENRTNSTSWDTSGLSGQPIKNLVFDLGGVILDLSVPDTLRSFAQVSGIDLPQVQKLFTESEGFLQYEKGEIGDDEFRDFVRKLYAIDASDAELDRCWNAMLLGIPVQKLDLLLQLKEKYSVYLLSNTNTIHLDYIEQKILPATGNGHAGSSSLAPYFHRDYYSHRMGKRKPDAEIFEQVLEENNLLPENTLFLDDNRANIAAAAALKIQTLFVNSPDIILPYFHG
jgi:putative hydrolase of the HAD superfamily